MRTRLKTATVMGHRGRVGGRIQRMSTRTTERIAGAAVVATILLLKLAFVAVVLGWV